jgi:hypothetical protein
VIGENRDRFTAVGFVGSASLAGVGTGLSLRAAPGEAVLGDTA